EPGGRMAEAVGRLNLDGRRDGRARGGGAGLPGEDEPLRDRGRDRERVAGDGERRAADGGARLQRVAGADVRDAQIGEAGDAVLRRDRLGARQSVAAGIRRERDRDAPVEARQAVAERVLGHDPHGRADGDARDRRGRLHGEGELRRRYRHAEIRRRFGVVPERHPPAGARGLIHRARPPMYAVLSLNPATAAVATVPFATVGPVPVTTPLKAVPTGLTSTSSRSWSPGFGSVTVALKITDRPGAVPPTGMAV